MSVDGSDKDQEPARNTLFKVSGVRGNYPQLFKVPVDQEMNNDTTEEKLVFVGSWDAIEQMNEANDIPEDILAQNPDIVTLAKCFEDVQRRTP